MVMIVGLDQVAPADRRHMNAFLANIPHCNFIDGGHDGKMRKNCCSAYGVSPMKDLLAVQRTPQSQSSIIAYCLKEPLDKAAGLLLGFLWPEEGP